LMMCNNNDIGCFIAKNAIYLRKTKLNTNNR
jgi:hypothetical protein